MEECRHGSKVGLLAGMLIGMGVGFIYGVLIESIVGLSGGI